MGYTHYIYTPKEINKDTWSNICTDAKKLFDYSNKVLGIELGNSFGKKSPIINDNIISFNGSTTQSIGKWTTTEDIFLGWPSDEISLDEPTPDPIQNPISGQWYAGHSLNYRSCTIVKGKNYADGSYETCAIERMSENQSDENGLCFECTKTNYKPYDLIVMAFYLMVKHYVPESVVSSDGDEKDYHDSRLLLFNLFGYGLEEKVRD